jgi:hypothetical protein
MIRFGVSKEKANLIYYLRLMSADCEDSHIETELNEISFIPIRENGYQLSEDDDDAKGLWQIEQLGRFLHTLAQIIHQQKSGTQDNAQFLDVLGERYVAQKLAPQHNPLIPLDTKQSVLDVSALTKDQQLCLLFQLYHSKLPEPVELKWCNEQTTKEELTVFFDLAQLYKERLFTLMGVNELSHDLQEMVTTQQLHLASNKCAQMCYIQVNTKHMSIKILFILTLSLSIFFLFFFFFFFSSYIIDGSMY